jgi:hypothetical protein
MEGLLLRRDGLLGWGEVVCRGGALAAAGGSAAGGATERLVVMVWPEGQQILEGSMKERLLSGILIRAPKNVRASLTTKHLPLKKWSASSSPCWQKGQGSLGWASLTVLSGKKMGLRRRAVAKALKIIWNWFLRILQGSFFGRVA